MYVLLGNRAVWLSNSNPSPISLKLRSIQKTVKANGRMDADSLNFAIRKLGRMDYKPLVRKNYISTDFAVISSIGSYGYLLILVSCKTYSLSLCLLTCRDVLSTNKEVAIILVWKLV